MLCQVLLVIKRGVKMKNLIIILTAALLYGCNLPGGLSGAGHKGSITGNGGIESDCAGMCGEFKADGTGCANFVDETSNSCATYFEKICKAAPGQCIK